MQKELTKQTKLVDRAETFERERAAIYNNQDKLQEKCNKLEKELEDTKFDMKFDYENEIRQLNYQHQRKIKKMKKQIESFEKMIEKVKHFVKSLVSWVCEKLSAYSEEQLMHDFKMDTGINIDIDRQLNFKVNEKDEHELEL